MIIGYGVRDRLDRPLRRGWETSEAPFAGTLGIWTTTKEQEAIAAVERFPPAVGARVVVVRLGQ